jgi:hypothetical protein
MIAAIKGKPKVCNNSPNAMVRSGVCLGRDSVGITSGVHQIFRGPSASGERNAGVAERAIRVPRAY